MANPYRSIIYKEQDQVATLTLNRPDVLNSMDEVMTGEIIDVIGGLRRPRTARVLVIASTGRCFSAGGNFDEIARLIEDYHARMDAYDSARRLIYGMSEIAVPVIVALQGDVYGLGASLALAGDIIVASRNVKIGDPHVKVGLVAGDGGTVVWPAAFGFLKAKRHLLTGEPISAEEAFRLGAISELLDDPSMVEPKAQELAAQVAALPPLAVQYTKRALNHAQQRLAVDNLELGLSLEQYAMTSSDLKEAIAAFKDKRPGTFENR